MPGELCESGVAFQPLRMSAFTPASGCWSPLTLTVWDPRWLILQLTLSPVAHTYSKGNIYVPGAAALWAQLCSWGPLSTYSRETQFILQMHLKSAYSLPPPTGPHPGHCTLIWDSVQHLFWSPHVSSHHCSQSILHPAARVLGMTESGVGLLVRRVAGWVRRSRDTLCEWHLGGGHCRVPNPWRITCFSLPSPRSAKAFQLVQGSRQDRIAPRH